MEKRIPSLAPEPKVKGGVCRADESAKKRDNKEFKEEEMDKINSSSCNQNLCRPPAFEVSTRVIKQLDKDRPRKPCLIDYSEGRKKKIEMHNSKIYINNRIDCVG